MPGTGASSSKRWCASFPSPTHLFFFFSPHFGFADAFPSGADAPAPARVFGGVWELGQSPEQTFPCLSALFLEGEGKPLRSQHSQPLVVLCVPRTGCLRLPAQGETLPTAQAPSWVGHRAPRTCQRPLGAAEGRDEQRGALLSWKGSCSSIGWKKGF